MTSAETPTPGSGNGHVYTTIATPTLSSAQIPAGHGGPSVLAAGAGLAGTASPLAYPHVQAAVERGLIAHGANQLGMSQRRIESMNKGFLPTAQKEALEAGKQSLKDKISTSKLNPKNLRNTKLVEKAVAKAPGAIPKAASIASKMAKPLSMAGRFLPGVIGVPGVGAAIGTALWCLDPSERRFVNNLIASTIGGGSAAPDIDAAPEPPRTNFLPLTHDSNRDPSIEKMDKGMTATNLAAFGYHPDDVWPPSNPAILTTPDFGQVIDKANHTIKNTTTWAQGFQDTMNKMNGRGPLIESTMATTKPQIDAMGELGESVLPKAGAGLSESVTGANDFYQRFREINLQNRREINNSTSGLIPFLRANHVNEAHMDDSISAAKAALDKMGQSSQKIATAGDGWTIPVPTNKPEPMTAPSPKNEGTTTSDVTPGTSSTGDDGPSLADAITPKSLPDMPGMPQMPTMPQMPGLGGGMPGGGMPGGGMPGGMPGGGMPMGGTPPMDPNDPNNLKGLLDDKNKENDKDPDLNPDDKKGDEDEDEGGTGDGTGVVTPGAVPGAGGNPDGAPPITEGESPQGNTAEIGGKTRTFDTPKAAQMAHLISMPGEGGGKTIEQAAAEAGYSLPSPDSDIGEQVDPSQIKPGDVIKSQPESGVYIGDGEVITESGQVKPIADVMAGMDGPHQGIFRLADDGAPAAGVSGGSPSGDHSMPNLDAGGAVPPGLENTDNDPGTASGSNYSPTGITPGGIPGGM